MFKRLLPLLAAILLLAAPALADTGTELCLDEFLPDRSAAPLILYTGKTSQSLRMRAIPDLDAPGIGATSENQTVQIFGYDQYWLFCYSEKDGIYYLGRHNVVDIVPLREDTVPYGVMTHRFVAETAAAATLYASPSTSAEVIETYPEGTRLSMWFIQDGWAIIPYKRLMGYMYVGELRDLTPVAPTADYAQDGDILAAFTSFYSVKQTELNIGRMENIRVGSAYIAQTYETGFEFDFNKIAGPYRRNRGYMPSPVLINGGTVAGYGGGTCQVSTTLYNALLQLSDGITILYRRPHGPGGASYAPHGVDAAVGNENLNFRFRNDYDFPVTIDPSVQNGALCICIRKGEYKAN